MSLPLRVRGILRCYLREMAIPSFGIGAWQLENKRPFYLTTCRLFGWRFSLSRMKTGLETNLVFVFRTTISERGARKSGLVRLLSPARPESVPTIRHSAASDDPPSDSNSTQKPGADYRGGHQTSECAVWFWVRQLSNPVFSFA
jgi:hypothetical protein